MDISWYLRVEDKERFCRAHPNSLCNEIDEASVSGKLCCSDSAIPDEEPNEAQKMDSFHVVRFVRGIGGGRFSFNQESVLVELEQDPCWRVRVEAYRSYQRGRYQDDIAEALGVSQGAVSKWLGMVRGELSRRMGAAYELFFKERYSIRPGVSRVLHDGGQGKPDIVLELRDGSYEIISVKCFNSTRSTISIPIDEINPDLLEAYRLQAQGHPVKVLVDVYNLGNGYHVIIPIPLDKTPKRLNFSMKK